MEKAYLVDLWPLIYSITDKTGREEVIAHVTSNPISKGGTYIARVNAKLDQGQMLVMLHIDTPGRIG